MKVPVYTYESRHGANTAVICEDCGEVEVVNMSSHDRIMCVQHQHSIEHLIGYAEQQEERIEKLEADMSEVVEYLQYLSQSWRSV